MWFIIGFLFNVFMTVATGTFIIRETERRKSAEVSARLTLWGGIFWFIAIPSIFGIVVGTWIYRRVNRIKREEEEDM